jgi:SP family general alpha glucoside:H+ symporter-like MFS transporter
LRTKSQVNLSWNIGGFIASGVTLATQKIPNEYSFRVPYMTHWVFPPIFFTAMWFAPESPWWLVRHGRLDEAKRSVERLNGKERAQYAHEEVANMVRQRTH